jgi:hypothetical protein
MMSLYDVRVLTAAAAFLLLPPVFGQRNGSSNLPPGGNAGPNSGISDPSAPGGRQQQQMPQVMPQEQRPVFLSGKVMVDDGTPPPSTVVIESICSGSTRIQAYTDQKGRFSFQFGDNSNGVFQDASVGAPNSPFGQPYSGPRMGALPGSTIERTMQQCDLQARLPGYQSESVSLAARRALDNPDLGTIILHPIAQVEGRVVSATSLAAPKKAVKAFEKGLQAVKKNKRDEAIKQFQDAVQLYPEYAVAWTELGKLQSAGNQPEEARKSFEAAIRPNRSLSIPISSWR